MLALNTQGRENVAIALLSPKGFEISPWSPWITDRRSQVADRSMSVPMTSSYLERRDVRGHDFLGISNNLLARSDLELLNLAR